MEKVEVLAPSTEAVRNYSEPGTSIERKSEFD